MINFDSLPYKKLIKTSKFNYFKNHPEETFCCIYVCLCLVNFKLYVGSSKDMKVRLRNHCSDLKRNRHHSVLLQRAYNLYGESEFVWFIIEKWPLNFATSKLLGREQFYLDTLNCLAKNHQGYNIAPLANKPPTRQRPAGKETLFIKDPNGIIHSFTCSIPEFCNENKLSKNQIAEVLNGNILHHRRWTLPDTILPDEPFYNLKHVDGRTVSFDYIVGFAKEEKISQTHIYQLLSGDMRSIKGWTLPENDVLSWEFIDRDGVSHKTYGFLGFCKEHGLSSTSMGNLLNGTRSHYLGWHLPHVGPQSDDAYKKEMNMREKRLKRLSQNENSTV